MPLITRVSRLFRADLNAVLDRIEEPDLLLRQAVREMEEDLVVDERRLKVLARDREQLTRRERDLGQALQGIEEELDVCFAAQKEDLARTLIKRRLEAQRMTGLLSRKRGGLETDLATLKVRIADNRERLELMRQKAELLAEEATEAGPDEPWTSADFSVREEDVEVAFLREKQRREAP